MSIMHERIINTANMQDIIIQIKLSTITLYYCHTTMEDPTKNKAPADTEYSVEIVMKRYFYPRRRIEASLRHIAGIWDQFRDSKFSPLLMSGTLSSGSTDFV